MNSAVPSTIVEVVKNLITPKGIKRNFEGNELLAPPDIEDNDDESNSEDDDESGREDQNNNNLNVSEQNAPPLDVDTPTPVLATNNAETRILLANISDDVEIQKGALFLDKLGALLEEQETSILFMPYLKRMRRANEFARWSIRKRMMNNNCKNVKNEGTGDSVIDNEIAGPSNDILVEGDEFYISASDIDEEEDIVVDDEEPFWNHDNNQIWPSCNKLACKQL